MNRELHIVGFRVGRETYGAPITSLHEIVRVPEITAVPDAPAYMEGVINLRGKIVSVQDLRKRLGETEIVAHRRNRILVLEHNGRLSGLIVDSASEVLKIPATDVEPSPTEFLEGGLKCVTGLGKHQGRLIILLDMTKLLDFSSQPGKSGPGEDKTGAKTEAKTEVITKTGASEARGAAASK
ncbi:MAG: chemotaxis protein CheW [Terriglobales bacterium]